MVGSVTVSGYQLARTASKHAYFKDLLTDSGHGRCHLVNSSVNIVSCPFPSLNVELVSLTTSRTQYRETLLNG